MRPTGCPVAPAPDPRLPSRAPGLRPGSPPTPGRAPGFRGVRGGTLLAPQAVAMQQLHPSSLSEIIRRLASVRDPACLLDASGQFLFVNEAWGGRAPEAAGDGPGPGVVGTSWLDGFPSDEVRRLHAEFLFHALRPAAGTRPRPEVHIVERNTPTSAVLVAMRMEPVVLDGGPVAVAITHTAVRERPIDEVYPVVDRPAEELRDEAGVVTQCACCRRVRDPHEADRWDLVPSLVVRPPEGSAQALCALCRELHYGQPAAEAG